MIRENLPSLREAKTAYEKDRTVVNFQKWEREFERTTREKSHQYSLKDYEHIELNDLCPSGKSKARLLKIISDLRRQRSSFKKRAERLLRKAHSTKGSEQKEAVVALVELILKSMQHPDWWEGVRGGLSSSLK